MKKYQERQKRKAIEMLKQLALRIHSGELIVEDFGFWPTNVGNRIIFRITAISRHDTQNIQDFQENS